MKNLPVSQIRNIHFVGIGGSGMSGIAEVLIKQGYCVTGSDLAATEVTEQLVVLGAKIFNEHHADNIIGADVIITSSAIKSDNPELVAARALQLPVIPRAQMLAELMRFHYGIAVAGTHGKTTTTSLIASIFKEAGLDPTFVIGGILNNKNNSGAYSGNGSYFVVEADESDASFLYFNPMISVVTNIDLDHMDTYDNSKTKLESTFMDFLHKLPFYGLAILCLDDIAIRESLSKLSRPVITYGFGADAEVVVTNFKTSGFGIDFTVNFKTSLESFAVHLNLPGKHNALNATAAFIVAFKCGIDPTVIIKALANFGGVARRMQRYGEVSINGKTGITLIDDYGHHPQEITVTLQALREVWTDRRLVLAFQPHRYSRTKTLFKEFIRSLITVDELVLLDIYPASEAPIAGITSKALANNIEQVSSLRPKVASDVEMLVKILSEVVENNDLLLIQGAGNIWLAINKLLKHQS